MLEHFVEVIDQYTFNFLVYLILKLCLLRIYCITNELAWLRLQIGAYTYLELSFVLHLQNLFLGLGNHIINHLQIFYLGGCIDCLQFFNKMNFLLCILCELEICLFRYILDFNWLNFLFLNRFIGYQNYLVLHCMNINLFLFSYLKCVFMIYFNIEFAMSHLIKKCVFWSILFMRCFNCFMSIL